MERVELVRLVRRIMAGEGETEGEADALIDVFEANVPHRHAADLIFHPPREMTAEEIVDEALAYEPTRLPPASD
jgi:hypothetical protein